MTKERYIKEFMSKELAACMLAEFDPCWYVPYAEEEQDEKDNAKPVVFAPMV